ncbi:MAG: hypothetical protein K2M97_01400, partial [Muribaculaceae bacterium]|nr:hypothetical protein [Muribaculaceae bacterium]
SARRFAVAKLQKKFNSPNKYLSERRIWPIASFLSRQTGGSRDISTKLPNFQGRTPYILL